MTACLLMAACLPAFAAKSDAAAAEAVLGTWTLVSADSVLTDGTRVAQYGEDPRGLLFFDAQGRYAVQILRAQRPAFAANDKNKGTDAENRATVQGTNSHFGHYEVDTTNRALVFRVEHASYPNWEGKAQVRAYTLVDDVLTYTVPTPTFGAGATAEVVWRRTP
jgi:polyisoprenoid-binding protein YceI